MCNTDHGLLGFDKTATKIMSISFFVLLFLFEYITKLIVRSSLAGGEKRHLFDGFMIVNKTNNNDVFLSVAFITLIGFVVYLYYKRYMYDTGLQKAGCGFIICGLFSNILDRIIFSGTLDYFAHDTFYFNIADFFIIGGTALFFTGVVYHGMLKEFESRDKIRMSPEEINKLPIHKCMP